MARTLAFKIDDELHARAKAAAAADFRTIGAWALKTIIEKLERIEAETRATPPTLAAVAFKGGREYPAGSEQ